MNNNFLLSNLRGYRDKLKLFFKKKFQPTASEVIMEIKEETSRSQTPFLPEESFPEEELFLDWNHDELVSTWEEETPTKISIDPAITREQIEKVISITGEDPAEIEKIMEDQMESLQESYDQWQRDQYEMSQGIIPGSGGIMTEASRLQGLKKLRQDRPELFDPINRERMKSWRETYFLYYHSFLPDERKTYFSELMLAPQEYTTLKLEAALSLQFTNLIKDHLQGKSFTIFTGSPIFPKEEVVTIIDLDPEDQKIIFKTLIRELKLFSSYYDFFYHQKKENLSDGERALSRFAPHLQFPIESLSRS